MSIQSILEKLDAEIALLEQAKHVLMQSGSTEGAGLRAGRKAVKVPGAAPGRKRKLSPEGRARIAEAQRKRWAARKRAAK